jgi:hypothetical protein
MPKSKPPLISEITCRDSIELQYAHDLIENCLEAAKETPLDADSIKGLLAAKDTLCWALKHENSIFQENIDRMRQYLQNLGIHLEVPKERTN